MADNGFKINKSINLNPQAGTPANPTDGDFFYDSTAQSFAYYHNGSWANFDSVGTVASTLWLTSTQFTPTIVRNSVVKVTGGVALAHLAGISASFSAKQITIHNAGTATIVVEPEDANEATANNRIQTPTGGSMNLVTGEVAVFVYDVTATRWLLVSISSNAGAQVIATDANPGLVTLHQPSLLPLDGVVLSDGDLNTANGVVGLDANKSVLLAEPLLGADYLKWQNGALATLGGISPAGIYLNTGISLKQNYIDDEVGFVLNDDHVHLGRRKLHFSNLHAAVNYSNYIQTSNLGTATTRGMLFTNETNGGTGTFAVESFNNGSSVDVLLTLTPTGGGAHVVKSTSDGLYLNNFWKVSNTSGDLAAVSADRYIHNVKDPLLVQDAATKKYAETVAWEQNGAHNGNFAIWQRGTSATVTQNASGWGASRGSYCADRWFVATYVDTEASGVPVVGNNTASYTRVSTGNVTGVSEYAASFAVTGRQTATGVNAEGRTYLCHDFDRDWVKRARGKSVTISFKWRKGAGFDAPSAVVNLWASNGAVEKNATNLTGTTSDLCGMTTLAALIPTSWSTGHHTLLCSTVPSDATTLSLQIGRSWGAGTSFGATNSIEVTDVVALIGDFQTTNEFPEYPLAGGSAAGSLEICQRFYETSALQAGPASFATGGNQDTTGLTWTSTDSRIVFSFKTRKWNAPNTLVTSGYLRGFSVFTDVTGVWTASRITDLYGPGIFTVTGGTCTETQVSFTVASPGAPTGAARTVTGAWAVDADFG